MTALAIRHLGPLWLPPPADARAWRRGLALQFLGGLGLGMLLGLYSCACVIKLGIP
jgi:hypothetical protein